MKYLSSRIDNKLFRKIFGTEVPEEINEKIVSLPIKISNVMISRYHACRKEGVCTYCFPHGMDTINNTWRNFQRNWKKHRKVEYKN